MDMPRHFHVVFDVRVLDLKLSIEAQGRLHMGNELTDFICPAGMINI